MVENFEDLEEMTENEVDEVYKGKLEIDSIFLAAWNTPEGKRLFEYLRERFVETEIIKPGETASEAWERQGKANLVRMMEKAVDDALTPPVVPVLK